MNQKTFGHCGPWQRRCQGPQDKEFFCFFFFAKKEALP
jgi:hypothetical protein